MKESHLGDFYYVCFPAGAFISMVINEDYLPTGELQPSRTLLITGGEFFTGSNFWPLVRHDPDVVHALLRGFIHHKNNNPIETIFNVRDYSTSVFNQSHPYLFCPIRFNAILAQRPRKIETIDELKQYCNQIGLFHLTEEQKELVYSAYNQVHLDTFPRFTSPIIHSPL